MRQLHHFFVAMIATLAMAGCGTSSTDGTQASSDQPSQEQTIRFREQGDSLSTMAQGLILNRLMAQISAGGHESALRYCSVNAFPIIDSISQANHLEIRRISAKYRNPKDQPNEADRTLLALWDGKPKQATGTQDTVVVQDGHMVYYKPIYIGMPTCLKCHGIPDELDPDASTALSELYPKDLATHYKLGDFRGVWRIRSVSHTE